MRHLGGGRHARAGPGAEAAAGVREARARARRPRARDRLRLGIVRADGGGGVRRAGDRADAVRAAGRGRARAHGRAAGRDPPPGLPDGRGLVHEDRVDRDARGDRACAVPRVLRRVRPAARGRRAGVRADDRDARTSGTSATAATTTGSAATSSRGSLLPSVGALEQAMERHRRFGSAALEDIGPNYAPTLAGLARAVHVAARHRAAARLRRPLRPDVGVLPRVLRGGVPHGVPSATSSSSWRET